MSNTMLFRDFKLKRRRFSEMVTSDTDLDLQLSAKDKDAGVGSEADSWESASQLDTTSSCGESSGRSYSGTDSGVDMEWERQSDASSNDAQVQVKQRFEDVVNHIYKQNQHSSHKSEEWPNKTNAESALSPNTPFSPPYVGFPPTVSSNISPHSVASSAPVFCASEFNTMPILAQAVESHSCKSCILAFPVLNWSSLPSHMLSPHPPGSSSVFSLPGPQTNLKPAMPFPTNHLRMPAVLHPPKITEPRETGAKAYKYPPKRRHNAASTSPSSPSSSLSSISETVASPCKCTKITNLDRPPDIHHCTHHAHPVTNRSTQNPAPTTQLAGTMPKFGASYHSFPSSHVPSSSHMTQNINSLPNHAIPHSLCPAYSGHLSSSSVQEKERDNSKMDSDSAEESMVCAVCGDSASGLHYGVVTCEGCKGFFKRTVQNKRIYRCMGNGDCEVTKTQRNHCQHCRLKKCILAGMVIAAVREDRTPGGRNAGAIYNLPKVKYKKHKKKRDMASRGKYRTQMSQSGVGNFSQHVSFYSWTPSELITTYSQNLNMTEPITLTSSNEASMIKEKIPFENPSDNGHITARFDAPQPNIPMNYYTVHHNRQKNVRKDTANDKSGFAQMPGIYAEQNVTPSDSDVLSIQHIQENGSSPKPPSYQPISSQPPGDTAPFYPQRSSSEQENENMDISDTLNSSAYSSHGENQSIVGRDKGKADSEKQEDRYFVSRKPVQNGCHQGEEDDNQHGNLCQKMQQGLHVTMNGYSYGKSAGDQMNIENVQHRNGIKYVENVEEGEEFRYNKLIESSSGDGGQLIQKLLYCDKTFDISKFTFSGNSENAIRRSFYEMGQEMMTQLLNWAKVIPFYSDLSIDVQKQLVEKKWHQILLMSSMARFAKCNKSAEQRYPLMCSEQNLARYMSYIQSPVKNSDYVSMVSMVADLVDSITYIIKRFSRIQVAHEEYVCLKIILLLQGGSDESSPAVNAMCDHFCNVLQVYEEKMHPKNKNRFMELMWQIPQVEDLSARMLKRNIIFMPFLLSAMRAN